MKFDADFHDRGMKKWGGYFLSEHTAFLSKRFQQQRKRYPQKRQMTSTEIAEVIQRAIIKQKAVTIQLEEVDENGEYQEDVSGLIQGGDELGLYVGSQSPTKVMFEEIRNIQISEPRRWNHVDFGPDRKTR